MTIRVDGPADMRQPKGGMCCTCRNALRDCSGLDFSAMRPVKVYPDGTVAVRCSQHEKDT